MKSFVAQFAWLGGESCVADVRITIENSLVKSIETGVKPTRKDSRIEGVVIPGFVNSHSHAFPRALRGRTHGGSGLGDFWAWRTLMYQVANRLTPENYLALATATFVEMTMAGITTVGEFHYVHHQPNGTRYQDSNEMGKVIVESAKTAGLRLALLDVAYLHAGLNGQERGAEQRRFSDFSIDSWLERVEALGAPTPECSIGLAPHSVRAVHDAIAAVFS
ncbi:MAG: amidohydrolase family protein, partial [Actinomycetota bacterium]